MPKEPGTRVTVAAPGFAGLWAACAGDAVKRIDLTGLGMKTGGNFDRGVPGMRQELAQ